MKRLLVFVALIVVVAFGSMGCDSNKGSSLAGPNLEKQGQHSGVQWRTVKVYYTSCGTYTASYSNDFIGPTPDGYCRQNGSGIPDGCTIGSASYRMVAFDITTGKVVQIGAVVGDPTSDE